MVTTIQLNEDVKITLERLKEKRGDSYEDVIVRMIKKAEMQKRMDRELMIEGAKKTAEESLKITKEFEEIDDELKWGW
ncbi:MAG TPA: hypothetical protein HA282_01005 [Nanoarchaeota archaeon]|nr:hypothetical protein [Candidatus Pacearchaeota archaeon]HIH18304.1 hypothetical protein [Nanoarchaeota archaeon]HIH34174.1 hypothetical protein [Nanoarchaeota archaeon]HIH51250.1 hypothetical protein [Nanoarchaeota archaeon]HIH65781.1 hypothetical protein [Nanoarchaeota archaeon]